MVLYDDFEQSAREPNPEIWHLCKQGSPAWAKHLSGSYDQAYVSDGTLKLTGIKDGGGVYRCGGIETSGLFSIKYGKVEVCARFTHQVQGGWPAIWMMPQNPLYSGWPACGEIDIMEHLNHDGIVYQTIHSYYRESLGNQSGTVTTPVINYGEFNTYGIEWTPDRITFTLNNEPTLVYENYKLDDDLKQWPFATDFYLILNFALGGPGTWPGDIFDDELPGMMEVDWVRITSLDTTVE